MPKPEELEREAERFLASIPDGGEQLLAIARMTGAILVTMREHKGSESVAAVLRRRGFTDQEIEENIVAAMACVCEMPHELWKHDA